VVFSAGEISSCGIFCESIPNASRSLSSFIGNLCYC
jgi:hypothetical protein